MKHQYSGKIVFITGASSGIGLEMAKQVARAGGTVAMFARRKDPMERLAGSLNDELNRTALIPFVCDVTKRDAVKSTFAAAKEALGPCDILIANAGGGYPVRVRAFDADAAVAMYQLNVFGVLYALEAVLPDMLARRSGHIVGVSSLAAFRSYPESHPYCATKSALSAHLEGLRPELLPYGVSVTTLCPGFIKTELTASNTVPMPMILEVDVAVRKMLNAIVRKRKRYVFPWPVYLFTRLSKLVPDVLLAKLTHGKSYKDV